MSWLLLTLCAPWWIMGLLCLRNTRQARRLADQEIPALDPWPALTIIAPARNEAASLERATRQRLQGDYPALEVVLVDDRSEDETGAIADALAAEDPRITVVHNTELPEGWLGKVFVLDLGARAARGDWILFSDADVEIAPGSLRRAVGYCERHGVDVLGVMPTPVPRSLWLGALYAVFLRVVYAAFLVKQIEDPRSSYGVGVGAFTLVRRKVLEASPGFAAIRMEVADDLMLGRMLKRAGARSAAMNGAGAVAVELYRDVGDFVTGAEKNAWGVSAGFSLARGVAFSLGFVLVDLAPWLLAALGPSPWLRAAGAVTAAWALTSTLVTLRRAGVAPVYGLAYPIGSLLFGTIMLRGTLLGWWRGGLQWRGTFYPNAAFRAARSRRGG